MYIDTYMTRLAQDSNCISLTMEILKFVEVILDYFESVLEESIT